MSVSPSEKMVEFALGLLQKATKSTGDTVFATAHRPKSQAYIFGRLSKEFPEHASEHRGVMDEVLRRVEADKGTRVAKPRRERPPRPGCEPRSSPVWLERVEMLCRVFDAPHTSEELIAKVRGAFGWDNNLYASVIIASEYYGATEYRHPYWMKVPPHMKEGNPRKMPKSERLGIIRSQRFLPCIVDCEERIDYETGIVSVIRLDNSSCVEQYNVANVPSDATVTRANFEEPKRRAPRAPEPEAAPRAAFEAPKPPKLAEPTLPSWAVGVPKLNVPEAEPEAEPEPEPEPEPESVEPEAEKAEVPEEGPEPESVPEVSEADSSTSYDVDKRPSYATRSGDPTTPGSLGLSGVAVAAIVGCTREEVYRYFAGGKVRQEVAEAIEKVVQERPDKEGISPGRQLVQREGPGVPVSALGLSAVSIAKAIRVSEATVRRYFRSEMVDAKVAEAIEKAIAENPDQFRMKRRSPNGPPREEVAEASERPSPSSEPSAAEKIAALEKQLEELKAALK